MLLKFAWRNVLRQKRRTVLTLLTMTGGFVLASLSIGWMRGSYESVIMFFTDGRTGQVQVHGKGYLDDPSIYNTIGDPDEVGGIIGSMPDVRAWAPRIHAGALLAARPRGAEAGSVFSSSAGVSVIGICPAREEEASGFSDGLVSGRMLTRSSADTSYSATGQMILGRELAAVLDVSPGDTLVMLSQAADGSGADRRYTVRGIVSTGNANVDRSTCYVTLSDAQLLFALDGRVHEIAVMAADLGSVDGLTSRLSDALSGRDLEVSSWKTFAREFHNAMKADEMSLKVMLFVILLVAAMGVLNTILMMVLERRREFGVMRAIGTGPLFIVRMIVLEALILGAMSVLAGSLVSTAGLLVLSRHGIVLDPPIEFGGTVFREMVATPGPECYWVPAACVILTAAAVSLFPALKAARTSPAATMRKA